jgi:hypothetical protein
LLRFKGVFNSVFADFYLAFESCLNEVVTIELVGILDFANTMSLNSMIDESLGSSILFGLAYPFEVTAAYSTIKLIK